MPERAFRQVALEATSALDKLETKLADVNAGEGDQLLGVGGKVPRLDLEKHGEIIHNIAKRLFCLSMAYAPQV